MIDWAGSKHETGMRSVLRLALVGAVLAGCGSDAGGPPGLGGAAGAAGVAGAAGQAGQGGAGLGGNSGRGGAAGKGAQGDAGMQGSGGMAGTAAGGISGATGGRGGTAGVVGHGGAAGGKAGAPGYGGAAGLTGGGAAGQGGAGGGPTLPSTCNSTGSATSKTPTVYVIGDSTASLYGSDVYPRMGWAQPLPDDFAPACATIADKALSGRSSKSFYDEGAWTPIKAALRGGDTVLIQFGHNDEKADATLHTDPFTTYEQYLSVYIDDTTARGATPILVTSINRNEWTNGQLADTHGNYPVAMRQLAQAKNVALIDATALTKTYFERIGQTATTALFMDLAPGQFPNYPSGNTDNTHLQEKGARTIGALILADAYRQMLPFAHLLKAVPQAP